MRVEKTRRSSNKACCRVQSVLLPFEVHPHQTHIFHFEIALIVLVALRQIIDIESKVLTLDVYSLNYVHCYGMEWNGDNPKQFQLNATLSFRSFLQLRPLS